MQVDTVAAHADCVQKAFRCHFISLLPGHLHARLGAHVLFQNSEFRLNAP